MEEIVYIGPTSFGVSQQAAECGKHLLIDAYDCKNLNNYDFLLDTIYSLIKLINMKPLLPPIVVRGSPHLPGLSCICIIETSHIAIHTFTDNQKVAIDVYSCKSFDTEKAYNFLEKKFDFGNVPVYHVHNRM